MVTIANSRQHNFSFPLVLCHLALCLLAENCGLLILNFHVLLAENNGPKLMCVTLFSYHIFQIVSNKCFSCFFSIVSLIHLVYYDKQKLQDKRSDLLFSFILSHLFCNMQMYNNAGNRTGCLLAFSPFNS